MTVVVEVSEEGGATGNSGGRRAGSAGAKVQGGPGRVDGWVGQCRGRGAGLEYSWCGDGDFGGENE